MAIQPLVRSEKACGCNPGMYAKGKSDREIVSMKQANNSTQPHVKCGQPLEEPVEKRALTKGNSDQPTVTSTQKLGSALSGLGRIREAAKRNPQLQFTNLMHHINKETLYKSYWSLKRNAASGIDEMTWSEYGQGLEKRILKLYDNVQSGRYRAKPSLRTWIPKSDGKKRPIGIAALEDKVVQQALMWVFQSIYENDFLGFSYGGRPGRNQHNALDALYVAITQKKVSWVLDADIRSFYDAVDHGWLLKFLEHRITDQRILRLVRKFLRAGVSEDGEWSKTVVGTPQGAVISPVLANIYLHYGLDLWVNKWRKQNARGEVYIVRFVDDFVMGFQFRSDAELFKKELSNRLANFELELHDEKTRLVEFGRFAAQNRKARGLGKPETFDFLGFTHICSRTRKNRRFSLMRKTITKRLGAKAKEVRNVLKRMRHKPVPEQGKWLCSVVRGHFNYYGVPGNVRALQAFRTLVNKAWLHALRGRSQKGKNLTWERMAKLIRVWIPGVRVCHPYPNQRLCV